jgi:hypothetical protein
MLSVIVAVTVPLGASARYAEYRGVVLGDSVATAVARLQAEASTVKVLYEQPSLIQELTWRPSRFISGETVAPDALSEMVLTFHLGELVRIAAAYDRERTQGLTDADLNELVSGVYGLSMLQPSATRPAAPASGRRTIGSWSDADTLVELWSEALPRRAGLVVTSKTGAAVLDQASATALRRESDAAPQRERDRLAAVAAAIIVRDEKIRVENKATFKP